MKNKILWLRIGYWWGIIADAVMAILMLLPKPFTRFMNVNVDPDTGLGYGLRFGAPLMIGWTVLLLWADRKPMERKDILLVTAYPVVMGYIILNVYSIAAGFTSFEWAIPILLSQVGLLSLSTFSYLNARNPAAQR
jgi:hypothetical protein